MTTAVLIGVTLLLQRALGVPGGPTWAGLVLLPAVWIAGPSLRSAGLRWVWVALVMGLGWDLLMESLVGPGAIAWSAAALAAIRLAGIVADRSPRAWFAFGAVAAVVMLTVQRLAQLPLGIDAGWRLTDLGLSAVATAAWCAVVGWIIALDLPSRWSAWRARKLR